MIRTNQYAVHSHHGGAIVQRIADDAEAFFQPGDEANTLFAELEAAEAQGERSIDYVIEQYGDLFAEQED